MKKTDKQWKTCLTPRQYRILRQKGTEVPFTGKYNRHNGKGTYHCAGCGSALFSSDAKYNSYSGWPSFFRPVKGKVREREEQGIFLTQTEVSCKKCGGHLGHVYHDGPKPTGLRYCINSGALEFGGTKPKPRTAPKKPRSRPRPGTKKR